MTGVPRLQHLPVPASQAGTTAVAVPENAGGQRVKAVVPVSAAQRSQAEAGRAIPWQDGTPREGIADSGGRGEERSAALRGQAGNEAAAGKLINFTRLSSMPFMVQVLGQQAVSGRAQGADPQTSLTGHRDAALLGSDFYRKAGGEPEILPDGATFVRLAV